MKPTLLILAAGMASRYGSMKQIQSFGPTGETIMDYSIYDAIRSGFGKVVFIIREDFAEQFKAIFEPKLKGKIEMDYVYQSLDAHTNGFPVPEGRSKPWGTAHAVLCAKDSIREPFAVINADDFYGRDAFEKAAAFLTTSCSPEEHAIIGYDLSRTLSPNGTVSRGVCEVDGEGNLVSIAERTKIYEDNGRILYEDAAGVKQEVAYHSSVSMNFWCFDDSIFYLTGKLFRSFLQEHGQEEKSEFFIPIVADSFIKQELGVIRVIPTSSQWFGVTYKEDAPGVQEQVNALVAAGEYPSSLWS
ncbi:MAG TPA: sugar phosphate nucleotidyltransferase [Lacibacter sp.]|nr:sugar phosphate nucleotidyltransferase [Lacibacter sp.]HMO89334.1 sugar phosphate nucleotidyltransferase [Lacibacter sp.]HMP87778.1 sugar phosphate nucleotidyltransferase [Lacibacter sp.]